MNHDWSRKFFFAVPHSPAMNEVDGNRKAMIAKWRRDTAARSDESRDSESASNCHVAKQWIFHFIIVSLSWKKDFFLLDSSAILFSFHSFSSSQRGDSSTAHSQHTITAAWLWNRNTPYEFLQGDVDLPPEPPSKIPVTPPSLFATFSNWAAVEAKLALLAEQFQILEMSRKVTS